MSLIVSLACLGLSAGPAMAPAAEGVHKLEVYGEGSSSKPLTIFETAHCGKTKKGGFFATSTSRDGDLLTFRIPNFNGYKAEYTIEQGEMPGNPTLDFYEKGEGGHATVYSNEFVPPYETVEFGEALFREGGKLLGIGYGPSMYTEHAGKAVFMTGVVECEKPKKGKPKGGGKKGKA
jgi:hypothetical protein